MDTTFEVKENEEINENNHNGNEESAENGKQKKINVS